MKEKGFVTLAVGNTAYFRMASNLLDSYLFHTSESNRLPFAILTDKENEYTSRFDDVVLVDSLPASYMAKIELLVNLPYKENIFIDADCLVYRNPEKLWDIFGGYSGVKCIGLTLPLDSDKGWFRAEDVGEYSDQIPFCIVTHGGVMYIKDDITTKRIYETCLSIIPKYNHYKFQIFSKPADEPIIALSMSVNNCRPIERSDTTAIVYCFLAVAYRVKMNIKKGFLSYQGVKGGKWYNDVYIIHWQNKNTSTPRYFRELDRLSQLNEIVVFFRFVRRSIVFFFASSIPLAYYAFKSFVYKMMHKWHLIKTEELI